MTRYIRIVIIGILLLAMVSMAAAAPAPLPTYDGTRGAEMENATWDFQKMLPIGLTIFTDRLGTGGLLIIYTAILITILTGIAIRQESVLIPSFLLFIAGQFFYWGKFVPVAWGNVVLVLFVLLPIAGVGYHLINRKTGG